jgi:hypothetical protein
MMSSRSFSRILAACAAGLSLVAVSTACAGEASEIGARGGFLVGQAYPCGVSAEQLRPSTQSPPLPPMAKNNPRPHQVFGPTGRVGG